MSEGNYVELAVSLDDRPAHVVRPGPHPSDQPRRPPTSARIFSATRKAFA